MQLTIEVSFPLNNKAHFLRINVIVNNELHEAQGKNQEVLYRNQCFKMQNV